MPPNPAYKAWSRAAPPRSHASSSRSASISMGPAASDGPPGGGVRHRSCRESAGGGGGGDPTGVPGVGVLPAGGARGASEHHGRCAGGRARFPRGRLGSEGALYSRDVGRAAKYSSNFDLYALRVANWWDTLYCRMLPDPPKPDEIPQSCREALFEYSKHIGKLGSTLFELLSEALGLNPAHLKEMECNQGQILLCHYYPPCPEPEVAIGTSAHSDSGFLTVLLQDHIGGLQILHNDKWVEVPPFPGALVINIADLLQLISNDRFKSVEHRVVAKREGPRISIACFFSTHFHPCSTRLYGPIKELISEENHPLYKETMVRDYVAYNYSRGLDGKSTISHFRLS